MFTSLLVWINQQTSKHLLIFIIVKEGEEDCIIVDVVYLIVYKTHFLFQNLERDKLFLIIPCWYKDGIYNLSHK